MSSSLGKATPYPTVRELLRVWLLEQAFRRKVVCNVWPAALFLHTGRLHLTRFIASKCRIPLADFSSVTKSILTIQPCFSFIIKARNSSSERVL